LAGPWARRIGSSLLAAAISGVVLWWLLADGAGPVLDALRNAQIWPLALCLPLVALIQAARAWRFSLLLSGRSDPPSWSMLTIATRLVLFNFILPFKLGELSFPVMLKQRYGTAYSRAAGVLVMSRLLDFGAVAGIFLLSAALVLEPATIGWSRPALIAAGVLALAASVLCVDLIPLARRLVVGWPRLAYFAEQLTWGGAMMRPAGPRCLTLALTASIWLSHVLIAWLVAQALATGLGPLPLAMAAAASNLAFALPVNGVAALGPPQAAFAGMLRLAGIGWDPAIAIALVCHGVLLAAILALAALTALGGRGSAPTGRTKPPAAYGTPSDRTNIMGHESQGSA
jgi:hypothetical protein